MNQRIEKMQDTQHRHVDLHWKRLNMEKWMVMAKRADFIEIGKKFGIDKVTARIIRNRDVIGDNDINMYINGGIDDLYDPKLLKDSDKLIDILTEKIKQKKKDTDHRGLRYRWCYVYIYSAKSIETCRGRCKLHDSGSYKGWIWA